MSEAINPVRKTLADTFKDTRSIRAFEDLFNNVANLQTSIDNLNAAVADMQNQIAAIKAHVGM